MMEYRIHGRVVEDDTGQPLAGFMVEAFDSDPITEDDPLGSAEVGEDGSFEIRYPESAFKKKRDILEGGPDIHVHVCDSRGVVVHRVEPRKNATKDEEYDIHIPRHRLDASSIR
jgi:hypothetical protein